MMPTTRYERGIKNSIHNNDLQFVACRRRSPSFRKKRVILSTVLLVLCGPFTFSRALSVPGTTTATNSRSIGDLPRPIRRVAIIGSGIAGLSTAHALLSPTILGPSQSNSERITPPVPHVTIFDSRPSLDFQVGAGIQLNGGLSVLKLINPEVQKAVINAGLFQEQLRSRCKAWNQDPPANYSNDAIAPPPSFDTLLELRLKDVIKKAGGYAADSLINDADQLLWVTIMRGALQESLYNILPKTDDLSVQFSKQLVDITGNSVDEGGIMCSFGDGSKEGPFDLVVGCDGIKSAVKEYVDTKRISKDASKREGKAAGLYTGLRIRYAVADDDTNGSQTGNEPVTLTQYFGDGAYCLSGIYGSGPDRPLTKCAFVIYMDKDYIGPFKRKKEDVERAESVVTRILSDEGDDEPTENADWTQDVRETSEQSRKTMLQQLRDCNIPSVDLKTTIEAADRFFDLGVYAHNPFCSWSRGVPNSGGAHVVLCGDAAHALPPFLGQGSNQAIQDAYCLGLRIRQYNDRLANFDTDSLLTNEEGDDAPTVPDVARLLKEYESIRWLANFQIFWKASFLGYLETGGVGGVYSKFRDVFFKTMGIIGVAQRVLLSAATPKVK